MIKCLFNFILYPLSFTSLSFILYSFELYPLLLYPFFFYFDLSYHPSRLGGQAPISRHPERRRGTFPISHFPFPIFPSSYLLLFTFSIIHLPNFLCSHLPFSIIHFPFPIFFSSLITDHCHPELACLVVRRVEGHYSPISILYSLKTYSLILLLSTPHALFISKTFASTRVRYHQPCKKCQRKPSFPSRKPNLKMYL